MLVVWHNQFTEEIKLDLVQVDPRAYYWPFGISKERCSDWLYGNLRDDWISCWWISFSSSRTGLIWVLKYGDLVEVRFRE